MATHVSHACLPWPVAGARFTTGLVWLNTTGGLLDPTTPDTEVSLDGAAFADATEEAIVVSTGSGYMTFTGKETNCSLLAVQAKGSGTNTTPLFLHPRYFPVVHAGAAQTGSTASITLNPSASAIDNIYNGCVVKTTSGTGGGGTSGSDNQARIVMSYNGTSKVATVNVAWETMPVSGTTYDMLYTDLCPNRIQDTGAISAAQLAADAVTEIATGVLDASWSSYQTGSSGTKVGNALAILRGVLTGKMGVSGTQFTVYADDDTTPLLSYTIDTTGRSAPA